MQLLLMGFSSFPSEGSDLFSWGLRKSGLFGEKGVVGIRIAEESFRYNQPSLVK